MATPEQVRGKDANLSIPLYVAPEVDVVQEAPGRYGTADLADALSAVRGIKSTCAEARAAWRTSTVGEACVIEDRLRKPINAAERAKMPGSYPYYGPTGVLDHIAEFRVDGEHALIGEDGDHFLKFDLWDMTHVVRGRFNVNNHAHLVRCKDDCRTEWFYYYFKHRDITKHLSRQGAGRLKLQKSTLERMPLPIPPIAEQEEIIGFLRQMDDSYAQLSRHVDHSRRLLQDFGNAIVGPSSEGNASP